MGLDHSRLRSGNRSASISEAPSTGLRKMLLFLVLSGPSMQQARDQIDRKADDDRAEQKRQQSMT